jgi:predicted transport protein
MSVSHIAQQMWRFSREQIAKGALDTLGEQTFTDGKVRKALDAIMVAAPRSFLNVVREAMGDQTITPQQVKESLARIWRGPAVDAPIPADGSPGTNMAAADRTEAAQTAWSTRRAAKSASPYNEAHHITGKPKEALELYRAIDRLCFSLGSGSIAKRYLAKCIAYDRGKRAFCSIHIQKNGLRVWLQLKYSRVVNPPVFARDVSNVGHWGGGDFELAISSLPQLEQAAPLIRDSFDASGR